MARAGLQIAVFLAVLTALAVPLGAYLQRVLGGSRRVALEGALGPVERGVYRLLRVDAADDQPWREYAMSMVVFSAVCLVSAHALLRVQSVHPLNPHDFHAMPWHVSFNTAVSLVTNTSWQFDAGRDEPLVLFPDRGHRPAVAALDGGRPGGRGSLAMLAGRYVPLIAALAVAGALAPRRVAPAGAGTLRTDSLTFAAVLTAVIVIVVVLDFLPALAIGPLAGELR